MDLNRDSLVSSQEYSHFCVVYVNGCVVSSRGNPPLGMRNAGTEFCEDISREEKSARMIEPKIDRS